MRLLNTKQLVIMSDNKKLDLILEQLKALGPMTAMLTELKDSISTVKEEVRSLQFESSAHADRLDALEKDMRSQKDLANKQQQQLRSLTVRLLNFPVSAGEKEDNNNGLKTHVYDRILKPLLSAAKSSKALSTLPQLGSVIEACFRSFNSTSASSPPPVIIKLVSRPIKLALLNHRKDLAKPTAEEIAAGISKFALVEDLTYDTHKTLIALSKSSKTAKVWTQDGAIRFILTGKSAVNSVKSVYDPVQKIIDSASD